MKIYKNGSIVFNSIDNTGSTNDASLGARYALGRLDSTHNNLTQNYYTKDQVVALIEQALNEANLLKAMVVASVPPVATASPNIIYLVPVEGEENIYSQYKKVLIRTDPEEYTMALLGSTTVEMENIQVTELPPATSSVGNKVLQYIGTADGFVKGRFYWCSPRTYYTWSYSHGGSSSDAGTYYTLNNPPSVGDSLYTGTYISGVFVPSPISSIVSVGSANITDSRGITYTKSSDPDVVGFRWVPLLSKLSEFQNDGDGTSPFVTGVQLSNALAEFQPEITGGASSIVTNNLLTNRALMSDGDGKVAASSVTTEELHYLSGVTQSVQGQFNILAGKAVTVTKVTPRLTGTTQSGVSIQGHALYRISTNISGTAKQFLTGTIYINYKNIAVAEGWSSPAWLKFNFMSDMETPVPLFIAHVDKPMLGVTTPSGPLYLVSPESFTTPSNGLMTICIPMIPLKNWTD